ncbi:MAG: hypothetical protein AAGC74_13030 [Verrucomicrobiota bacterium]
MILDDAPDPVRVPRSNHSLWIQILFWLFMLSFAFDHKTTEPSTISKIAQFGFLALAVGSTTCIILLGFQYLLVRPGGWILFIWGLFLTYMVANAFLQGVPPGRSLRTGLPFFLSFAAMLNAHIAACSGIRLAHLATPVFVTAIINIIWRVIYGLLFSGVTLETVRVEILSPALSWSAAFIGCSILLRTKLHWTMLLAAACLFGAMIMSVTRSLLFPMAASALLTSVLYLIGLSWGAFRITELPRKLSPLILAAFATIFVVAGLLLAVPHMALRWQERLFSPTSDRNMASDPSLLTRQAEATAIFDILDEQPLSYLNGKGVGASFYWDDSYFPELYIVYDPEELEEMSSDIWYAGHSIWTYSLFSGGLIALVAFIGLFIAAIAYSIASAAANARLPGPDYWLLFLPAVAAFCILSESATSNPFDERLLGMIFGATFSFSQAGFIRSSWIPRTTHKPERSPIA